MKALGNIIHPIFEVIASLLAFYYGLIPNYAVAITLLTLTIMVLVVPFTVKSTRSMIAMQRLQPELKKIQQRYKGDREAQQRELMALYKEHGVNPLGGCLPMLIPLPIWYVLFYVLRGLSNTVKVHGVVNADPKYISHTSSLYHALVASGGHMYSFGVDLSRSATSFRGDILHALPFYAIVVAAMALQYIMSRQMMSRQPASSLTSQSAAMQKFMPLIIGFIYIAFPAGVNIYVLVSNLVRIVQQSLMFRFDPTLRKHVADSRGDRQGGSRDTRNDRPAQAGQEEPQPGPRGMLANLRAAREELRSTPGSSSPDQPAAPGSTGWGRALSPSRGSTGRAETLRSGNGSGSDGAPGSNGTKAGGAPPRGQPRAQPQPHSRSRSKRARRPR